MAQTKADRKAAGQKAAATRKRNETRAKSQTRGKKAASTSQARGRRGERERRRRARPARRRKPRRRRREGRRQRGQAGRQVGRDARGRGTRQEVDRPGRRAVAAGSLARRSMAATVSLVIPSYNEERRLPRLAAALRDSAAARPGRRGARAGRGDRRRRRVARRERRRPAPGGARSRRGSTPLIREGENEGKGAAVEAGVARARGDLVLVSDVDLAAPLPRGAASCAPRSRTAPTSRSGRARSTRAASPASRCGGG